jgi:hypothetical protein
MPFDPDNIAVQVSPALWVGDIRANQAPDHLSRNGVTAVVALDKYPQELADRGFRVLHRPFDEDTVTPQQLDAIAKESCRFAAAAPGSTLVQCKRGHHRSAAVASLCMRMRGRLDATADIKKVRPGAFKPGRRLTAMVGSAEKRPTKRSGKIVIAIVVMLLVLVAAALIWHRARGPAGVRIPATARFDLNAQPIRNGWRTST